MENLMKRNKFKRSFLLLVIMLIICVAIVIFLILHNQHLSPVARTAKNYLQEQGYKVHDFKESYSFTMNEKGLRQTHTKKVWELVQKDPRHYLGKKINIEMFIVTNHPLNKIGYKRVQVSVYVVKGKVLGGISYPYEPNQGLGGLGYSLDGKTLEQIQGKKH